MAKAKTAKAVKAAKVPETVYISEADQYLFAQGTHYDIYKKLGAHQSVEDGKKGMSFAVWAPHAASVSVIGTFNSWNETANQMEKLGPGGIYKTFIPDVGLGELYKLSRSRQTSHNGSESVSSISWISFSIARRFFKPVSGSMDAFFRISSARTCSSAPRKETP